MAEEVAAVVGVVEDDVSIRRALVRLLRSDRLKAETFASAEEFLVRLPKGGVGCLILDLRMPGMTGLELQARMTASGVRVPVIVITAHDDPTAREQAMSLGAVEFFRKPFDARRLLDAVHSALERKASNGARP